MVENRHERLSEVHDLSRAHEEHEELAGGERSLRDRPGSEVQEQGLAAFRTLDAEVPDKLKGAYADPAKPKLRFTVEKKPENGGIPDIAMVAMRKVQKVIGNFL